MRTKLFLFLAVSAVSAQSQVPGKRFTADVTVNSLVVRGDTIGIGYVLVNRPQSQDSIATFTVDAPAGVIKIPRPEPITDWWVSSKYQGKDVAHWAILGTLPPGATSIPLYFESVGLPGIVTDWVVGNFPVPEGEGDDTTTQDELRDNAVTGKTVGVERFPPARTPLVLLARLRVLTDSSCTRPLLWISDPAICKQLLSDLDQARSNHTCGRTTRAKEALEHYHSLLSGSREGTPAHGVTSAAYVLLQANAENVHRTL